MDIGNYTWVNTFEPENLVPSTNTSTQTPTSTNSAKTTNTSEGQQDVNNQLTTIKVAVVLCPKDKASRYHGIAGRQCYLYFDIGIIKNV